MDSYREITRSLKEIWIESNRESQESLGIYMESYKEAKGILKDICMESYRESTGSIRTSIGNPIGNQRDPRGNLYGVL